MNLRQVHTEHRMQGGPGIESRCVGGAVAMTGRRQPTNRSGGSVAPPSQRRLDPCVAGDNPGLVGIVKFECLPRERRAPRAIRALG